MTVTGHCRLARDATVLAEVRTVLLEQVGNLLEFADEPEATQFLQSKKYWPTDTAVTSGPGT